MNLAQHSIKRQSELARVFSSVHWEAMILTHNITPSDIPYFRGFAVTSIEFNISSILAWNSSVYELIDILFILL
jgi:hypothetical protein